MTTPKLWKTQNLEHTRKCATYLAVYLSPPLLVFLSGPLGAGKTHWVRCLLNALGYFDVVPSPSYALAFSYKLKTMTVHHIDCFRLQQDDTGDDLLELIGDDNALCLVEWPECASNLPAADLHIHFEIKSINHRDLIFFAHSQAGHRAIDSLPPIPATN